MHVPASETERNGLRDVHCDTDSRRAHPQAGNVVARRLICNAANLSVRHTSSWAAGRVTEKRTCLRQGWSWAATGRAKKRGHNLTWTNTGRLWSSEEGTRVSRVFYVREAQPAVSQHVRVHALAARCIAQSIEEHSTPELHAAC